MQQIENCAPNSKPLSPSEQRRKHLYELVAKAHRASKEASERGAWGVYARYEKLAETYRAAAADIPLDDEQAVLGSSA